MQCKSRAQSLFYAGTRSSSVRAREFATPRISLMLIFFCVLSTTIFIYVSGGDAAKVVRNLMHELAAACEFANARLSVGVSSQQAPVI